MAHRDVKMNLLAVLKWTLACLVFSIVVKPVTAVCYFSLEYQGTFLIQAQASPPYAGNTVTYSEVTVEADSIPPWGRCHRRRGNNVILKDTTGGENCMRCFHLTLKTPNVIQIHTEGLGKCYTNEEAARATCPDDRAVLERRFKEIMLFRKPHPGALPSIENLFCPINGKYRFTYTANSDKIHCEQPFSELSNCPHGNGLNVRFRQCSFPDMDISFLCLGDWPGPNGDRYLALMDQGDDSEARPKYRCGLYRKDPKTNRVYVALSPDSTCNTQLTSATNGFEKLVLSPLPERSLPAEVESSACRFPEWTQGQWEHVLVDGSTFVYKDHSRYQTVTARCILRENTTPSDRFIIYTISHCGEEAYNCIWLHRRSPNVLEFQLGPQPSNQYSESLCHVQRFEPDTWITQGRIHMAQMSPCPITGDYTGTVPGTTGLCAKVSSDCNNPDIMFYTVSNCEDRTHVYEEREYRCLGSWEEKGVLYTYTQRREMDGYQCFSGKVLKDGEEAFIKEAGESCIRGEDPLIYGMKIIKQSSCPQLTPPMFIPVRPPWVPVTLPPQPPPMFPAPARPTPRDPYWYQTATDQPTTKPWKPITGRPRPSPTSSAGRLQHCTSVSVVLLLGALVIQLLNGATW